MASSIYRVTSLAVFTIALVGFVPATTTTSAPTTTTTSAPTTTKAPDCPAGWTKYTADRTCIKAFGKDNSSERANWTDARASCQSFGGDLIKIEDAAKNTFTFDLFGHQTWLWAWIGIWNNGKSTLDVEYVDGTSLGNYNNFGPDIHIPAPAANDHCVIMFAGTMSNSSEWFNCTCGTTGAAYACSKPYAT